MMPPTGLPTVNGPINSDDGSRSSHYTISSRLGREEAINLVKTIMHSRNVLKEENRSMQLQKESIQNNDFQFEQILRHCIGRQALRVEELESTVQLYKASAERDQLLLQKRSKRRNKERELISTYRHQVYRLLRLVLSFLETKCINIPQSSNLNGVPNDYPEYHHHMEGHMGRTPEKPSASSTKNVNEEFVIKECIQPARSAPPRLRMKSSYPVTGGGESDDVAVMVVCTPHQRVYSAPCFYHPIVSVDLLDVMPLRNPFLNPPRICPIVWPPVTKED